MDCAHAGPRRLRMETLMPCACGASVRRKAAGEACSRIARGRNMKKSASPDWAARCSRRSSGTRIGSAHRMSAAQQLWRSTCSAAHQVSRSRPVSIQSRRWVGRFQPDQHRALGLKGGCNSTTGRSGLVLARAGCSRRISPMPCARTSSSVRVPTGQPAPCSSASSTAWPVDTVGPGRVPNSVPRQSAGWMSWGAIAMGV